MLICLLICGRFSSFQKSFYLLQGCPDPVLKGRNPDGISIWRLDSFHMGSHFASWKHFRPGRTENLAGPGLNTSEFCFHPLRLPVLQLPSLDSRPCDLVESAWSKGTKRQLKCQLLLTPNTHKLPLLSLLPLIFVLFSWHLRVGSHLLCNFSSSQIIQLCERLRMVGWAWCLRAHSHDAGVINGASTELNVHNETLLNNQTAVLLCDLTDAQNVSGTIMNILIRCEHCVQKAWWWFRLMLAISVPLYVLLESFSLCAGALSVCLVGDRGPVGRLAVVEAPSVASGKQGQRNDLDWTDQKGP